MSYTATNTSSLYSTAIYQTGTATTSSTMWVPTQGTRTVQYIATPPPLSYAAATSAVDLALDIQTRQEALVEVREIRVPVPVSNLERGKSYDLPDGAVLSIDAQGNYLVRDAAAKVVYKANRIREFNPYVNASDLLEDFIRDMGEYGVRQSELLGLPVNVFIHWLILKAAQRDGDEARVPSPQAVLPKREVRCLCCGRFLPRTLLQRRIFFCTPDHMARYASRPMAALPAPAVA